MRQDESAMKNEQPFRNVRGVISRNIALIATAFLLPIAVIVGCSVTPLLSDIQRKVDGPPPLPSGSFDPTFGSNGRSTVDIGWFDVEAQTVNNPTDDYAVAAATQSSGKIVVAGDTSEFTDSYLFAIARFNADGSIDKGFGPWGTGTYSNDYGFDSSANLNEATSMAVLNDGSILVAGSVLNNKVSPMIYDFAVARFTSAGNPDTSFGSYQGMAICDIGGDVSVNGVGVQSDGKIVVGGSVGVLGFARFNSDGTMDSTIGGGGGGQGTNWDPYRYTPEWGGAVAIQNDDKIVLAGSMYNGTDDDLYVLRFTASGRSLDLAFNKTQGANWLDFGSSNEIADAVTIQEDGKIVVAGDTDKFDSSDICVARFTALGDVDDTFGPGGRGYVITRLPGRELPQSLVVQSDGKIVVAGTSHAGSSVSGVVLRYNSDGTLDSTFGNGGKVTTAEGHTTSGVTIAEDGKIVTAGSVGYAPVGDFEIARLLP